MTVETVQAGSLTLSRLALGTMTFGGQVQPDEARRLLDCALDAGVTLVDTANAYTGGRSEEILGELLAGRRDAVVLASKVGIPTGPDDGRPLSAAAVRSGVEASLRRLRTDHLDLVYLHQPDWQTPVEETFEAVRALVDDGLAREVGVSNYPAWQLAEVRALRAVHPTWPDVVVSQPQYNLLSRRLEDEYARYATRAGLVNVVYNPLAGGLLTGKHRGPDDVPAEGSRFALPMYRERYWRTEQFRAVDRLRVVAEQAGLTLPQLSFAWLLGSPLVGAVLLGASRLEHLVENLRSAAAPPLGQDVLDACDEVWSELSGAAPAYSR